MKTLSKILTLGLIISLFSACAIFRQKTINAAYDEGVVINGIRWATRSVDAPGTFALYPESPGMFFQWSKRKGWCPTNKETEGWITEGWTRFFFRDTEWYAENDPCPDGWRLPTQYEFESLIDAGSKQVTQNGVNGLLFGTVPNQIFLPAVGLHPRDDGPIGLRRGDGNYWSSTRDVGEFAVGLWFISDFVMINRLWRTGGFSIRCVAK